ncbi:hypothetical protein [Akkermansia sp.]|uniref:hypothetical protein n=1 Tax=Akkermansia sp. TaxID=1872421 RepID=UPI003A8E0E3C
MEWTLPVERFNVWEEPSGWTTLANAALPVVQISSQGSEQGWQGLLSLVGGTLLESKGAAPGRRQAGAALSGLVAGKAESETGVFMAARKMNGLSTHRTEKQE